MNNAKVCGRCGHPATMHRLNAAKNFSCDHSVSGRTTTGIIGEPWTKHCYCEDYSELQLLCRICKKVVYPLSERTAPRHEHWEASRAPIRGHDELVHMECENHKRQSAEIARTIPKSVLKSLQGLARKNLKRELKKKGKKS